MSGAFPLLGAVAPLQIKPILRTYGVGGSLPPEHVALYTETEAVTYLLFFLVFFLPYEALDFLLVFFTEVWRVLL